VQAKQKRANALIAPKTALSISRLLKFMLAVNLNYFSSQHIQMQGF